MSFFAILFALLLEQARPLSRANPVHAGMRAWTVSIRQNFDAGREHHGWVAWGLALVPAVVLAAGVYWLLMRWVGWPIAMLWNVVVLYVTLGFRQFSHHFTRIRDALESGDEAAAREGLATWRQVDASEVPRSEVVRHVIEYSVLSAHRHVFGVLFWFTVLAALGLGPAGAVMYRVAEYLSRYWSRMSIGGAAPVSERLQQSAKQAWMVLDWLPARMTALGFAVVGSFEEAIDGWRFHTKHFPNDNDGVILAATAGAINVRLGGSALKMRDALQIAPIYDDDEGLQEPGVTPGWEAEISHLRSVVGPVWRSVVVWMLLIALLSLARLLG
ncbi:MAG: CobD/CbiB family protein [Comamonas sp.]|nr:CobD/CbiB family protein [Candidatus Comamonas equi]